MNPASSAPAASDRTGSADHPAALTAIDRRYIVSWGQREVFIVTVLSLALGAPLVWLASTYSPLWGLGLIPVVVLGAFGILFFRNPTRRVPTAPGLLVSPADGTRVSPDRCCTLP